jgi:hypothetical protein
MNCSRATSKRILNRVAYLYFIELLKIEIETIVNQKRTSYKSFLGKVHSHLFASPQITYVGMEYIYGSIQISNLRFI